MNIHQVRFPVESLDTDNVTRIAREMIPKQPKRVPSVGQNLHQLEAELSTLTERADYNERRASESRSVFAGLKQKLADITSARKQLASALNPNVSMVGLTARIDELWLNAEKVEEKISACQDQIERHDNIAKYTRKLIAEWPHHETLKELRALEKAMKLAAKI